MAKRHRSPHRPMVMTEQRDIFCMLTEFSFSSIGITSSANGLDGERQLVSDVARFASTADAIDENSANGRRAEHSKEQRPKLVSL